MRQELHPEIEPFIAAIPFEALDEEMLPAIRAAKVETSGDIDSSTVSFSSLKQDFNDVFKQAVDLLQHPDIFKRIAWHGHNIRELSHFDRANLI